MEPSKEQILSTQGTRLSNKAPWESYDDEMGSKLSPELDEAVKRYEERRHQKISQAAEEELARQRELSDATADQYRFIRPEEYEELEPRIGHVMHSSVFINKLRKECNLDCWYAEHPLPRRLTLIVDRTHGTEPPEIACWAQEGFMVEFEWMNFDEHGVPLDTRRRGYRTCLLQMILKGILTEELVDKVFGKATGPASTRYNSLLYEWRHHRIAVKEENARN